MKIRSQLARHKHQPRRNRIVLGDSTDAGVGFHLGVVSVLSPDQVPPNALVDSRNVVLGLGGELEVRRGCTAQVIAATGQALFEWVAKDKMIIQIGASLYKTAAVGGGSNAPVFTALALIHTFTTTARVAMCEFNTNLVVCHPVDGVFDYDDTTWTLRNATVKGNTIAVHQNKVWVSGVDATVWWSNIGSSATWTTASDFNQLREDDDTPVRALVAVGGQDILGRPGLLAIKDSAVHRIHDAATGAYTTLDFEAGCFHHYCTQQVAGVVFFVGKQGAFVVTNGVTVKRVSDNIQQVWARGSIDLSLTSHISVGVVRERFRVSYKNPSAPAGEGDTWEFDPFANDGDGAWTRAMSLGFFAWARYTNGNRIRYYACHYTRTEVWEIEAGGVSEDPTGTISWYAYFGILQANPGGKFRVREITVFGKSDNGMTLEYGYDFGDLGGANVRNNVNPGTLGDRGFDVERGFAACRAFQIGLSGVQSAPHRNGLDTDHAVTRIVLDVVPLT